MQVTFCDRCGKETAPAIFQRDNSPYKVSKNYLLLDLCPKCKKDLEKWFENKEASK